MPLRVPLHPAYATTFANYLDEGENLLWFGQPRQGVYLRASDTYAIPFSLMWGGFAIFWETTVLFEGHRSHGAMPLIFPLWGIPFVVIGLHLIFGRFFYDSWLRKRTWYGVTDQRALIFTGGRSQKLVSFNLMSVNQIELQTGSNGFGTITFGAAATLQPGRKQMTALTGRSQSAFETVAEVGPLYHLIRKVQNEAAAHNR